MIDPNELGVAAIPDPRALGLTEMLGPSYLSLTPLPDQVTWVC